MPMILPSSDILYSRPGSESTTNRYWVGVGVMQSAHGAVSSGGVAGAGASGGWGFLSYGAFRERKYLKFPSVSNTWMRRLPRSATYTLSLRSIAMLCGLLIIPGFSFA